MGVDGVFPFVSHMVVACDTLESNYVQLNRFAPGTLPCGILRTGVAKRLWFIFGSTAVDRIACFVNFTCGDGQLVAYGCLCDAHTTHVCRHLYTTCIATNIFSMFVPSHKILIGLPCWRRMAHILRLTKFCTDLFQARNFI
jgi:hypothetical protein